MSSPLLHLRDFGSAQPKISRYLAYLRNAGILTMRRNSKWLRTCVVMTPNEGVAKGSTGIRQRHPPQARIRDLLHFQGRCIPIHTSLFE